MRILWMIQPLVEVAQALIDVFERCALDPVEAVPADRIAIEEFQAKRRPQIIATVRDLKQKNAARRARQRAAKTPEA
jgi:hypothetical protein